MSVSCMGSYVAIHPNGKCAPADGLGATSISTVRMIYFPGNLFGYIE